MFAKLRRALNAAKLLIDVTNAKQRLRYPQLKEVFLVINNVPVVVCNDSVLIVTGIRSHLVGGVAFHNPDGSKTIAVTEASLGLPASQLNALISHEYYHLLNGDKIEKNHYKELESGEGFAMEKEYAADAFALSEGHDILGLLAYCQCYVSNSTEFQKRIELIKSLMQKR